MRLLERFRVTWYLGALALQSHKRDRRTWQTTRSSRELGIGAEVGQETPFPATACVPCRVLVLLFSDRTVSHNF